MSGRKRMPGQKQSAAPPAPVNTGMLQRRHTTLRFDIPNSATPANAPVLDEALRSPGEPLEPATRGAMEGRFGYDFSGVRVHTDERGRQAAASVNARAFAFGQHIAFGAGEYSPRSASGSRLLAHELAHVVQQTAARHERPENHSVDQLERTADHAADAAVSGSAPVVIPDSSALRIARAPDPRRASRNFENAQMITVELPSGTVNPGRLGYEKDFHGYLPANVIEDDAKWHASHAVGPGGMGVEREEGILLAPRGVNLSVQKNLENHIKRIREIAPEGAKLTMKIETGAHPGTRRLAFINYELHVSGEGGSGPALTASVRVSDDLSRPVVDVSVGSVMGEASRRYDDGMDIRKQRPSSNEPGSGPLRPKSPDPATYSSTAKTTKRHEVPTPEVVERRPKPSPQPQTTGTADSGTKAAPGSATDASGSRPAARPAPGPTVAGPSSTAAPPGAPRNVPDVGSEPHVSGSRPAPKPASGAGAGEHASESPEAPRSRGAGRSDLSGGGPGLAGRVAIGVGVIAFSAGKTILLGSLMDDAIKRTPSLAPETGSAAQLLQSLLSDQNLAAIRILTSDVEAYANGGYRASRPPSIGSGSFVAQAIAVDTIKDDNARMEALNKLRLAAVNDLQELERANDNIDKILSSEPAFNKRIKDAKDLKAMIGNPVVAEKLMEHTGLSPQAWTTITSNLANYIVNHEATLASLHSLRTMITADRNSSTAILKMLNEAAERNAHIAMPHQ